MLQAYLNICCQINTPAALTCNTAFKKHKELIKQIKKNYVNNIANVKKKSVYGAAFARLITLLYYIIKNLQKLISKP